MVLVIGGRSTGRWNQSTADCSIDEVGVGIKNGGYYVTRSRLR